jgi:hypothetical protein
LMISHIKIPAKSGLSATYLGEVINVIVKIVKKCHSKLNTIES